MKSKTVIITGFVLLAAISACRPDLNTDFDPPAPNAKIDDIFPLTINNWVRSLRRAKLIYPFAGAVASYENESITIDAVLAPDGKKANEYFKTGIIPNFDKMKNHIYKKTDGRWRASGTDSDGRKWFAWVNHQWIFMISGIDEEHFKLAVNAFRYIEELYASALIFIFKMINQTA